MGPGSSSVCRSCRQRLIREARTRSFSTSSSRCVVPPESPFFVDVPSSHQPYLPFSHKQKGTLPIPRELFPASKPERASKQYLESISKERLAKNVTPETQLTAVGRHKAKMSDIRKQQLREGIVGLRARKQAELKTIAQISSAKQLQRDALLNQAEREDARLTNTSIPHEMQSSSQPSLEALRAQVEVAKRIHGQKVENYARIQAEKHGDKMDALHSLYMNARQFVTTQEQLTQLIKDQFEVSDDPDDLSGGHASFMTDRGRGTSLWNFGPPESLSEKIAGPSKKNLASTMLHHIRGSDNAAGRFAADKSAGVARFVKDQERMKKIAEKLSGGKI